MLELKIIVDFFLDVAQRTADWLGVGFHPVSMDEQSLASRLEDVTWHSESPLPDVNGMGRLAMAERARAAGLKVVLTGQFHISHGSWPRR